MAMCSEVIVVAGEKQRCPEPAKTGRLDARGKRVPESLCRFHFAVRYIGHKERVAASRHEISVGSSADVESLEAIVRLFGGRRLAPLEDDYSEESNP